MAIDILNAFEVLFYVFRCVGFVDGRANVSTGMGGLISFEGFRGLERLNTFEKDFFRSVAQQKTAANMLYELLESLFCEFVTSNEKNP